MGPAPAPPLFTPIARAVAQVDDPAFQGVLIRSIAWSVVCFAVLYGGTVWAIHRLLDLHGVLAWGLDIISSVGASLLALWLFLPVAVAIGTLYFDRIVGAVEHRYYHWLPQPEGASMAEQAWDGLVVAAKVLGLNLGGLILALLLPGVGLILGWMIAAYAIGRGLFVAVAMRRMSRLMAESLYRSNRGMVLVQGAILALAAYIPVMNLLIPVIGTAAMVHVLDMAISAADEPERHRHAFGS